MSDKTRLVATPAMIPPGRISRDSMSPILDTMNATIRECVFATEFLETGAVHCALASLQRIKDNADRAAVQMTDAVRAVADSDQWRMGI